MRNERGTGQAGELDLDSVRAVEPAPAVDPLALQHGATVDDVGDVVQAPAPSDHDPLIQES